VASRELLTHAHFPRLVIPLATVLADVVDFAGAAGLLALLLLVYGVLPRPTVLAFPLFVLLALVVAIGVGLWLAVFHVRYRDVGHLMPLLMQAWMFMTPVVYPTTIIPEPWRGVLGLNPMAGVVEGIRWSLFPGEVAPPWPLVGVSAVVALLVFAGGVVWFRKAEDGFADTI
jgi:lipopolysaccharide transport system permease protein